jgi:hypothetical protein
MFRKILMQAIVGDIHTCMHTQVAVQYYQCLLLVAGPGKKYLIYIYKYLCVHVRSTCTPPPSNVQTAEGEGTVHSAASR